jgi:uncharacterized membrane protein YeiH
MIGVFAFAVYGSHKAISARLDLFGILVCGALTALGGGTIRELILIALPVYMHSWDYLIVTSAGVAFAIVIHNHFAKLEKYLVILDAIGIAVFAYVGAYRADASHLGLAAIVLFATLTVIGGGVLCDALLGRKPDAFYKDFYPLAAIVLAMGYYLIRPAGQEAVAALALIAMAFAVRLFSIRFGLTLWRPHEPRI